MRKLRVAKSTPRAEDDDSFARVARGDLAGLGEIYDRHAHELWRFVRRAAPREDAEDIVHTVFVRLVRIAGAYDGRASSARAWLFGVAAHVLRERRRSLRRFADALLAHAPTVEDPVASSQATTLDMDRALLRLTEAKRMVLLLAEVEGFTCPEISRILRIPVGTVWTRLHHARRELRSYLEETP